VREKERRELQAEEQRREEEKQVKEGIELGTDADPAEYKKR
jgi:hypothetical protein